MLKYKIIIITEAFSRLVSIVVSYEVFSLARSKQPTSLINLRRHRTFKQHSKTENYNSKDVNTMFGQIYHPCNILTPRCIVRTISQLATGRMELNVSYF